MRSKAAEMIREEEKGTEDRTTGPIRLEWVEEHLQIRPRTTEK